MYIDLTKKEIGKMTEELAKDYLRKKGLKMVCGNYSCKAGEIDLIMLDGECLVFVEVRARTEDDYGTGLESITRAKQTKIIRAAKLYLLEKGLFDKISCRFDVISIKPQVNDSQILWIKDAFWVKY